MDHPTRLIHMSKVLHAFYFLLLFQIFSSFPTVSPALTMEEWETVEKDKKAVMSTLVFLMTMPPFALSAPIILAILLFLNEPSPGYIKATALTNFFSKLFVSFMHLFKYHFYKELISICSSYCSIFIEICIIKDHN